ncbi:MAG: Uma2 family endonuclease [Polyangiaceae bacterium]|nr:Uma2 family endonuclease [Polyangiaceae bacterium]
MASPARTHATYADLLAVPPGKVAQLIGGVLHTHPRPAARHTNAASVLGEELGPPFRRGRGGPGGWVILDGPELHLGADILVPDLSGWRRARMPEIPDAAFFTLPPDWVCEVLSPSTEAMDRDEKLPVYARECVAHVWLVDPIAKTLEVLRLDGDTYRVIATWRESARVHAEPFDAIELDLSLLWQL